MENGRSYELKEIIRRMIGIGSANTGQAEGENCRWVAGWTSRWVDEVSNEVDSQSVISR